MNAQIAALALYATSALAAWTASGLLLARLDARREGAGGLHFADAMRDPALSFALLAAMGGCCAALADIRLVPVAVLLAALASRKLPGIMAKREADAHRKACEDSLDTLADIVSMGVGAGLSFDASLALYCEKFDGPLAQEMRRAQGQWQSGLASRRQALEGLAARLDSGAFKRFASTVLQAVEFGSPLADMLSSFARDLRSAKRADMERKVEKAPVKMLVPMGTCILPAMLMLVMGPVVLQFLDSGL